MPKPRLLLLGCLFASATACHTVDPGDNFVPPDLSLDEDFFFCRVQPEVISASSCASGAPGEGGSCHSTTSALRLDPQAELEAVECAEDQPVAPVPPPYESNLRNIRITVQPDPFASPLYRRPLMLDSHPRAIFDADSPEAMLIVEWVGRGTM